MLDSYRDLIDGLLQTPNVLREALGNPIPGDVDSAVADKLLELRVREAVNLRRTQAMMRRDPILLLAIEDEPEIRALRPATGEPTPEADLATFSHDRSELISILVNLTLKDWERPVNHDRTGETTLAEEIEDHLTWDEEITASLTGA
jgi:hypothetical protein